jgi:hypothetical protein
MPNGRFFGKFKKKDVFKYRRGGVGVTQNGVGWGGGGDPRLGKGRSPLTNLRQGVCKRSGRFEPYMLRRPQIYTGTNVIWFV